MESKKLYVVFASLLVIVITSCGPKLKESVMKERIAYTYENPEKYKAGWDGKDLGLPQKQGFGDFYKNVKVSSVDIIETKESDDGKSIRVKCIVSGTAEHHNVIYSDKLNYSSIYDKTVSFNHEDEFVFKKDEFGEWH